MENVAELVSKCADAGMDRTVGAHGAVAIEAASHIFNLEGGLPIRPSPPSSRRHITTAGDRREPVTAQDEERK
jgi:hypothetical protein